MPHPNSSLFTDHWVPWAEAHPIPETLPATWKNQCGKHVFEAVSDTVGWKVRPKVVGPTAAAIAAASGWLNPDHASAPIGAFHFWADGPGHTGWDMNGGGEVVAMATTYPLIWKLQSALGVQSIAGYKGPYRYLGWSTNYGGGIPNPAPAPAAPPAPAALTATQRKVGWQPAHLRPSASTEGVPTSIAAGTVLDVLGFVTAKAPTVVAGISSSTWFHVAAGYIWAGGMTDMGTHDLKDETPIVLTSTSSWAATHDAPTTLSVPDPHRTPASATPKSPAIPPGPSGPLAALIAFIASLFTGKR